MMYHQKFIERWIKITMDRVKKNGLEQTDEWGREFFPADLWIILCNEIKKRNTSK